MAILSLLRVPRAVVALPNDPGALHGLGLVCLQTGSLDEATYRFEQLLAVKPVEWRDEVPEVRRFLAKFGGRMPSALWDEVSDLRIRLDT